MSYKSPLQNYPPRHVNIQQKQPLKDMATHLEEERKAVARHLEKLIERERNLGLQIKEEYDEKIGIWKQRLMGNQVKQDQYEKNVAELENSKNIQKSQIQQVEEAIKDLQSRRIEKYKNLEEQMKQSEDNIQQYQKQCNEELNEQQRVNFMSLRELDEEWGKKCDQMMDENRKLDDFNQDLLQQCESIKDKITKFNSSSQSQTMDLVEKVKKAVLNEIKEKLREMEIQVEQIDQDRLNINRQNNETLLKAQKELKNIHEELSDMIRGKTKFEVENRELQIRNYQLEQLESSIKQDLDYRQKLEKNIQQELDKIKEKEFKISDHEQYQLQQINRIYSDDLEHHNQTREQLREREQDLIKGLQDVQLQNHRLSTEITRINEPLQKNALIAVNKTFTERQVI